MALSLRVNDFLSGLFIGVGLRLVDFKLEFGRLYTEDTLQIVLADEISPDNCRLWDSETYCQKPAQWTSRVRKPSSKQA